MLKQHLKQLSYNDKMIVSKYLPTFDFINLINSQFHNPNFSSMYFNINIDLNLNNYDYQEEYIINIIKKFPKLKTIDLYVNYELNEVSIVKLYETMCIIIEVMQLKINRIYLKYDEVLPNYSLFVENIQEYISFKRIQGYLHFLYEISKYTKSFIEIEIYKMPLRFNVNQIGSYQYLVIHNQQIRFCRAVLDKWIQYSYDCYLTDSDGIMYKITGYYFDYSLLMTRDGFKKYIINNAYIDNHNQIKLLYVPLHINGKIYSFKYGINYLDDITYNKFQLFMKNNLEKILIILLICLFIFNLFIK